jgi:hypothetical protein
VQALQGAGGRALVGGLTAATRQSQESQNRMLAQERAMRAQAGQQLAIAEERSIGRKEARSQQELAYANQAYQAAVGNIAAGVGSAAEGLMYMSQGDKKQKDGNGLISKAKDKSVEFRKNRQEKKDFKSAVEEVASRGLEYEGTVLESVPEVADNVQFKGFQWYNMGGMMTNGAYNHNTNPIDLVQDGQKVGEATGGEYIVNPMQAAAIAKESSYARKLFKRFEKNAKKNK